MSKFWKWLKTLFTPKKSIKWSCKYVQSFKDIEYQYGVIYYNDDMDVAKFLCPCGCKEIEVITLGESVNYKNAIWVLEDRDGIPSIYESVFSGLPCNSHYFIKNGTLIWA